MVESIACVKWIWTNIFDVGGNDTGSEGLYREVPEEAKGKGIETNSLCNVEELQ